MKKLVLVLAIFCSVSVSMSYASDIKELKKGVIKIENVLTKAATIVLISSGNTLNFPKPLFENTPEQCAYDAWMYYYYLVDIGYSTNYPYNRAQILYNGCVSN
jgi:hypothetical protein